MNMGMFLRTLGIHHKDAITFDRLWRIGLGQHKEVGTKSHFMVLALGGTPTCDLVESPNIMVDGLVVLKGNDLALVPASGDVVST